MNENKVIICDDEKTISLIDLCCYVLGKWKIMIIAAVVLAVVAGGFSYLKSGKEAETAATTETKVLSFEKVEDSFETEDALEAAQNKIIRIEKYQKNLEERDYYLENSVKVKLDPNRFYEGTATYVITGDDEKSVLKSVALLENQILSEETFEKMAENLSETKDIALLKEVVTVKSEQHMSGAKVVVKVVHYEQEECKKMLETLPEDSASVELIDAQVNTKNDLGLMSFSSDVLNERNGVYDAIKSLENGMSELEKAYYELLNGSELSMETEPEMVQTSKASVDLKIVIVGAVLGAFAVAGLYGVYYLFSGYVHTKEELESWISAPVLNMGSDLEMNATMIAGIVGERNADKIYLTSSLDSANETFMKELADLLKDKNIETVIGQYIWDNPSALQKAVETGAMVLVEKCYKSKEKDIRETIVKANSCGVRICSVILEK